MCMLHTLAHQSAMQELDLLNPVVDPRITFTRATTKTYYGSDGLLKTAAANVWPLEYDPVTLKPVGRSVWESRTNLFLQSEAVNNAAWVKAGGTISSDATVAPDGALTADKLVESALNEKHTCWVAATKAASPLAYAASVFLKAAGRARAEAWLHDGSGAGYYVFIDLATGAVTAPTATVSGWSAPAVSLLQLPNGWWRLLLSATSNAVTTVQLRIYANDGTAGHDASYLGDGASGIYVWGGQLEQAAFAGPYIPTTTAAVTRSAEFTPINSLASLRWNASTGTVVAYGTAPAGLDPAGNSRPMWGADIGANTDAMFFGITGTNQPRFNNRTGGVVSVDLFPVAIAYGISMKSAARYASNNFAVSLNGAATIVDSAAAVPAVTVFKIGYSIFGWQWGAWLKSIRIYPAGLSNSELQAMSA